MGRDPPEASPRANPSLRKTSLSELGKGRLFALSVNRLLDAVFDLSTGLDAPDYLKIARDVMARVTHRSLVAIVTNLRDEDSEDLRLAARLLAQRHLVLVASLRESVLDASLARAPRDFAEALRTAGAHDYLAERRAAHERVARSGILLLDSCPATRTFPR